MSVNLQILMNPFVVFGAPVAASTILRSGGADAAYQIETTTGNYQLEGSTGVYLLESAGGGGGDILRSGGGGGSILRSE